MHSTNWHSVLNICFILLVCDIPCTWAYPTGADGTSCGTMEPFHGSLIKARTDISPFVVLVSKAAYGPGETVNVMLRGLCGTKFMGFHVQARRSDPADRRYLANPNQPIGSFTGVQGTKFLCGGAQALTHSDRYNGTTLLFNWTAPVQPEGHIQIKATFVERFDSYWLTVASVVIRDQSAPPMSINASSLRTAFMTPCETDRAFAPNVATPSITTTSPVTTTTSTMLMPIRPLIPTATLQPHTTAAVAMTADVTESINPLNVPLATTVASKDIVINTTLSATVGLETNILCGESHGCFHDCDATMCNFRVAWQSQGSKGVWFDVMIRPLALNSDQWVAVAFSSDRKMGEDSVVDCMQSFSSASVQASYNNGHKNEVISKQSSIFSDLKMALMDGYLHCQFFRSLKVLSEDRIYDLDKDWYILLAQGITKEGTKLRHERLPEASASLVDFQSVVHVQPWRQDRLFIIIHGAAMTFAWVFCAGFGIVMARFYKPLWPATKLCGRRVWFTVHRLCMLFVGMLTIGGFIIIFLEAQGLSEVSMAEIKNLHPVIGIIVTAFTIVQVLLGLFRPSAASKNRPVFNWAHWGLGILCHMLAVFNMALGLTLRKASVHLAASYILYAYAVYQVGMVVIMEIITCNMRMKEKRQASYVIHEHPNIIYSSSKDMDLDSSEPPGSLSLHIMLRLHLFFTISFSAAIIAIVAIAH